MLAALRWEEWSDCSTSCGPGQRFRTRAPNPQQSSSAAACLRPAFEVKSAELYGGRRSAARSASASGAVRCELCCSAARPCEEAMMQTGGCGTANETPGCREPQS